MYNGTAAIEITEIGRIVCRIEEDEITSVKFPCSSKWESPETYPQVDWEAVAEEIIYS